MPYEGGVHKQRNGIRSKSQDSRNCDAQYLQVDIVASRNPKKKKNQIFNSKALDRSKKKTRNFRHDVLRIREETPEEYLIRSRMREAELKRGCKASDGWGLACRRGFRRFWGLGWVGLRNSICFVFGVLVGNGGDAIRTGRWKEATAMLGEEGSDTICGCQRSSERFATTSSKLPLAPLPDC